MKKFISNIQNYILVSFLLVIIGFVLIIYFAFNPAFNDGSGIIDSKLASEYGNLIGGLVGALFSLAGLILIYTNFIAQKKSLDIQQFENKFFELIRYHRENVRNIEINKINGDKIIGHNAFVYFKNCIEYILDFIKLYLSDEAFNEINNPKNQISIAYIFFFYGFEDNSLELIKKSLKGIHKLIGDNENTSFLDVIFNSCKEKVKEKFLTAGHQEFLGHYFRHLYNSFMFIKNYKNLNSDEKYNYGKILRSQLSTYEQAVIFYNILTPIGESWIQNNLIDEFQIIKNIPTNFLKDINPKDFFNNIKFEWEK